MPDMKSTGYNQKLLRKILRPEAIENKYVPSTQLEAGLLSTVVHFE